MDPFEIPESWGLSAQQECLIGSLLDEAGEYLSADDLCDALYPDDVREEGAPAPAKLRVLIQRCRDILHELSGGRADIEGKRGTGWRITKKGRVILRNLVAE